jgi:UrcA family protein
MKTKLFAAALTLAAFTAVAPTNASNVSGDGVPSLDVTYSDLNLANSAGAEALLRRILAAASQVCGDASRTTGTMIDVRATRERRLCVRTAIDNAVRQVNAPLVTALYRGIDAVEPRYAEDLAR